MLKPAIFVVALSLCLSGSLLAQKEPTTSSAERKVTSRVAPSYPELAKRMHLQGVVKVEVIVRPNGAVKSTRVLGGNPVLVDSATEAVKQWKFEPGSNETTELVQLTFVPQ
jgi:TonB family protein